jgi:hypothetical protein
MREVDLGDRKEKTPLEEAAFFLDSYQNSVVGRDRFELSTYGLRAKPSSWNVIANHLNLQHFL